MRFWLRCRFDERLLFSFYFEHNTDVYPFEQCLGHVSVHCLMDSYLYYCDHDYIHLSMIVKTGNLVTFIGLEGIEFKGTQWIFP